MTIASSFLNILDNANSNTEFYVEHDEGIFTIDQIKVTYDSDGDLTEVTLVAEE
jgi:hypothetical protein